MRRAIGYVLLIALLLTAAMPVWRPLAQEADDNGYIVRYLENALSSEGFTVDFIGVVGILSSKARVAEITIADETGIWLRIQDASIDWTRTALLNGEVRVNEVAAERITVLRKPVRAQKPFSPEATVFRLPDLPVAVYLSAIKVAHLEVKQALAGVDIDLSATASLSIDDIGLGAKLEANRKSGGVGRVHLDVTLDRPTGALAIDFSIDEAENGLIASALDIPNRPPLAIRASGAGSLAAIDVALAVSTDRPDIVTGSFLIEQDAAGPVYSFNIEGAFDRLAPRHYQAFFSGRSRIRATTSARQDDGPSDLDFEIGTGGLALSGRVLRASDGAVTEVSISGTTRPQDGDRVVLPFGNGQVSVAGARLELHYDRRAKSGWAGQFEAIDFQSSTFSAGIAEINAAGDFVGGSDEGPARLTGLVDLTLDRISSQSDGWAQSLLPALSASTSFDWSPGQAARLTGFRIAGDDYTVAAEGAVNQSGFDGEVRLSSSRLERFQPFVPHIRPSGAVDLVYSGTYMPLGGAFGGDVTLQGRNLAFGIPRLDRLLTGTVDLRASASRDANGIVVRDLDLTAPAGSVKGSGQMTSETRTADLSARFDDLAVLAPYLDGKGTASLRVSGPVAGPDIVVEFVSDTGLSAAMAGQAGDMLDLSGQVRGLPLQLVNEFRSDLGLAGRLSGSFTITGVRTDPMFGFDANVSGASMAQLARLEVGALDVAAKGTWHRSMILLTSLNVTGSGLEVAADGDIDLGAASLNMHARGQLPLHLAGRLAAPGLLAPSGQARFDLMASGPIAAPSLSGGAEIKGAGLVVPTANLALRDISADLTFTGNAVRVTRAQGRIADGGSIEVQGMVAFATGGAIDLNIGVRDMRYSDAALISSRFSGDVNVRGTFGGALLLSGLIRPEIVEIALNSAVVAAEELADITHRAAPHDVLNTLRRADMIGQDAGTHSALPLALQLRVEAPRRIFVRGRGLDAELGGAIDLAGPLDNVATSGGFSLIRGRLDFLGKRLDLTGGRLTFSGSLDPAIDFTAESRSGDLAASLRLTGTASAPELALSSDPALPQDEILARMVFNRSLSKMSVFQITQLASAVAELSGQVDSNLIERLRLLAGVDNLDLRVTESGATGGAVGKYLNDNIYSEVEVDTQGKASVTLNLDMTDTLSMQATADNSGKGKIGLFFEREY